MATEYVANSFSMLKRNLVIPTALVKEPTTNFSYGNPIPISSITKGKPAVVTTSIAHGLLTGNNIVIKDNANSTNVSPDWDWMRNDSANDTLGGNGVLFKVEVVDATTFKLHDYVHSANNNIPCRHVHGINRIRDGFTIVTGEKIS